MVIVVPEEQHAPVSVNDDETRRAPRFDPHAPGIYLEAASR
jgi:hypothetical protein